MTVNKHTIGRIIREIEFCNFELNGYSVPVVAISGGVDSMVLAELFRIASINNPKLQYKLVHFHHDQGRHDDECAKMVERYVDRFNLRHIYTFHRVDGSTLQSKSGFETIARKARYAFLSQHTKSCKTENDPYGMIVTGHHLNDQVENIFMGISRGVPIDRVAMAKRTVFPNAGIKIYRPLLEISRKDILTIAARFNLEWSEDETNMDTKYERNFFRHSIIPLMETRRNILKSVIKSIPTPEVVYISHDNNLLSAEHNHFL